MSPRKREGKREAERGRNIESVAMREKRGRHRTRVTERAKLRRTKKKEKLR